MGGGGSYLWAGKRGSGYIGERRSPCAQAGKLKGESMRVCEREREGKRERA